MIWSALAIAALLGLALAIIGWRGRRIDDHPLCRKCGYDLFGSETAVNCPECGRDLWLPRARRIGHRRKRVPSLALGVLLLLATLGAGGALGWAAAKGFDFNPYKPLWMLKREAGAPGQATAAAAQQEILARLNAGKLSKRQVDAIVAEGLKAQGNPKAVWQTWWGDFIVGAWTRNLVGNDVAMQYVKTAVHGAFTLEAPARARQGSMLWCNVLQSPMRAGAGGGTFMIEMERGPIRLEDGSVLINGQGRSVSSVSAGSSGRSGSGLSVNLPVGKHRLSTDATVRFGRASQNVGFTSISSSMGGRGGASDSDWAMATWTLHLETDMEVVPRDAEIVEKVRDALLEEPMRRAVVVTHCRAMTLGRPGLEGEAASAANTQTLLTCQIEIDGGPMEAAFEVFARLPGSEREWPIGAAATATNGHAILTLPMSIRDSNNRSPRLINGFPLDAERVELVLRPSERVAEEAGLTRMWDGEIVIKDVPIERLGMAGRTSTRGSSVRDGG